MNSASMDAEASQFGDQILSVLKDAGFDAAAPSFEERAMSFNRPGVFFGVKNREKPPAHALPVWRAFRQEGFVFEGQQDPTVPDEQTVVIGVSSHP